MRYSRTRFVSETYAFLLHQLSLCKRTEKLVRGFCFASHFSYGGKGVAKHKETSAPGWSAGSCVKVFDV
ncbi:MAG: hypothetical protein A3C06_02580 [Candidatus Taylorbacteria bacterium RIFCSPHIGHO2_02_FULL_46_13]|uniref:Uncharacterized protein n=1 Tax=Candidatus Taylorbacteria bacterium RIFCSPHIGHO2_02_FULL_46_13 TaxID=1802312 RepID=A0A1G2MU06_9BACT|nr:MAG: hypothetical protein A3C06_02580 [Candidatus Taylorbacteria bacterium RIFCSPHIGHO2_02_FULL_46_13]